jgi:VanZ family protein
MSKFNTFFNIKWLIIAITCTATVILLTHIPQKIMLPLIKVYSLDKLYHVVAYGAITLLFIFSLKKSPSLLFYLLLFFAIGVVGIIDEVTQPLVNRTASFSDFAADTIGIVTILLFSMVCKNQFQKTKTE